MIITIDGPSLSGKSTVARALAEKLDGYYIYSGLLFRGAAYIFAKYADYDEHSIHEVTEKEIKTFLNSDRFLYSYSDAKGAQVFFDDVDITSALQSEEIGNLASCIGKNSRVRDYLKNMQHELAHNKKVVIVDGRDSGSAVFKDADFSFYVMATLEERSRRMQHAVAKKNKNITADEAKEILQRRDMRDSGRSIDPLTQMPSMIEIDTTGLRKNETVKKLLNHIESV